jgi:hypothetical protein
VIIAGKYSWFFLCKRILGDGFSSCVIRLDAWASWLCLRRLIAYALLGVNKGLNGKVLSTQSHSNAWRCSCLIPRQRENGTHLRLVTVGTVLQLFLNSLLY